MKGKARLGGIIAALALVAAACSSATPSLVGDDDVAAGPVTTIAGADTTPAPTEATATTAACSSAGGEAVPWTSEVAVEATTYQEPGNGEPGVQAVVYPHPDYRGRPWSQWGQGYVTSHGRFYSAVGDHLGADGNSYIYEYDPETSTLTLITDILDVVDHVEGDWGFGKVHAQMVEGPCGEIFLSTYWGSRRGLEFTEGYQGDLLLELDPDARTTAEVGVILPEHGVASLASWPEGGLLYAEATDPFAQKQGSFVVLDAETGEVVFENDDDAHGGYRTIAVDPSGRAFITWNDTSLAVYDPATNTLTPTDLKMPGGTLRGATVADADGTVYAVSKEPPVFFSLSADGEITEMTPATGYTTSIALAPDGSRFYYVPSAHGRSWQQGAPLIAVDTATGEQEVVVELQPIVGEAMGMLLGGTYGVSVDATGKRVYIGLNSGDAATGDDFGEIVLVVVTLP